MACDANFQSTYTEVDNSPKSLASSLTGESMLAFSKSTSLLVFGVSKTGRLLISADVCTHSTRQHDALTPTASDITSIHIQLYNYQQFVYVYVSILRYIRSLYVTTSAQSTRDVSHDFTTQSMQHVPSHVWCRRGDNV